MGVFRTIMVLTGITVFMPAPPEEEATLPPARESVSVVWAATRTVADVASFCSRQPGVCDTAGYVVAKLEAKAKYSVRLIYEWASEANGEPPVSPLEDVAASDPIPAGSAMAAAQAPRSTLTIDDLIPRWREPKPRRQG